MRKPRIPKKTTPKAKRTKKPSLFVVIPLFIITLFILAATTYKIVELIILNQKATFPTLKIALKDVPIEQINAGAKDIKYPGNTVAITLNNNTATYTDVEVKGRGNSTWGQIKKPYQIKFSEKINLFNRGATKKWVLLAEYLDPTYLRNNTAFFLESLLEQNHIYQGDYAELYIDNDYHGLYYIVKKINTDNLKNGNGILVELDNHYGELDGCNYDSKSNCFIEKDIVNEDYSASAMEDFISSINLFHEAIIKKDFESIEKIIDIDSFAKYFLLNEFASNIDAYSSSFYMHKDGEQNKIFAGPSWDFDYSFGSYALDTPFTEFNFDLLHSPSEKMALKFYMEKGKDIFPNASSVSTLIYDLMDIPEFQQRVKEIYQETLSGHGEELLDYIKKQAEYIKPAVLRDQERWKQKTNFDEEVDYLIDWVAKRYDHFEQTYGASTNSNQDPAPESPQPSQE